MTSTVNLGRVQPIYQGDYDNTKTYRPLDFVSYNSLTYFCIQTSTGNLPTDEAYWRVVATAVDAVGIAYDNATSGLSAEQVQAAIDEVVDNFDDHVAAEDNVHGIPTGESVEWQTQAQGRVDSHAAETGGIHGIPGGERALNSQELLAAVSEATDIDKAVEFVGKGAIVESGSNSNGQYIRWENGEQVATGSVVFLETDYTAGSPGTIYFSTGRSANLAASFASIVSVKITEIDASYAIVWGTVTSNSGATCLIFSDRDRDGDGDVTVYVEAWGYWK